MKRTSEIVLGIIGSVLYGFALIGVFPSLFAVIPSMYEATLQPGVSFAVISMAVMVSLLVIVLIVLPAVGLALGITGTSFLVKEKSPKVAGAFFLAAGVLSVVLTSYLLIAAIGSVFYSDLGSTVFSAFFGLLSIFPFFVSGIMCLARK
ncbi:DUF4064 domain-containing protein [Halobacillus hunanensis]|uniref:DUF4064 domain-containing protein n=1 Tax=Halobacillus hunanensis TaxID=578214 RepID=UPI0009A82E3A|nr:DUF4064 domain-containing protein [Halobacillus hunanensis]